MEKQRYHSFSSYLRGLFGKRVQRIPLDAGLGCPHRDRDLRGGCIYCDPYGSGTGSHLTGKDIRKQMEEGLLWAKKRYGAELFIAYFQSYTNTYAPIETLKRIYDEAVSFEGVVGLFIATRPDCINHETLDLISSYKDKYLVWIELGLQSKHDQTLQLINRGHDLKAFDTAFRMIREREIPICTHVIVGLPNETHDMIMETAQYLSQIGTDGIKIHSLYVLKGTKLWELYQKRFFQLMTQDEFVDLVVRILEILPPNTVIMRLTGDPPRHSNFEPQWAAHKHITLNKIHTKLKERDTFQGKGL